MPYAVISDVHSNLSALHAVLKDIERRQEVSAVYFTGDVVGYGPKPDECIDIIKEHCNICLAGNHDWAVIGYTDISYFNENALKASLWTRSVISDEHIEDITNFKIIKKMPDLNAMFVHSTPDAPEDWKYIFTTSDAEHCFQHFDHQFCFIGHSHFPGIFEKKADGDIVEYKGSIKINETSRYIINSGSVGQPRDGDPRASYVYINGDFI
ncbi:MAG: metallophosphoesterase, partial [Candidatus Magnetoovum sp. WYHC-5]|nr:metallophosphoesterase [Candidatus Magnetoovum sp. WYHC-5]